jgi:hypothetical protein
LCNSTVLTLMLLRPEVRELAERRRRSLLKVAVCQPLGSGDIILARSQKTFS